MTAEDQGYRHWASILELRDEVVDSNGSVGELQMSLLKAVYQTVPVPYASCVYYCDITQPTPKLIEFFARVARCLIGQGLATQACFHLDQGMGGGKSHALVGVWHMVKSPNTFFNSNLGAEVLRALGTRDGSDLKKIVPVVLTCDSMSPGKIDPRFGPATDLFGRFLWLLFANRSDQMDLYQRHSALGANKATLQAAFAEVDAPVLILIDELMDYVLALTDESSIGRLPGEQAFLNALTDAADDQSNVALILAMIKSEEDESGYHPAAEALRAYLAPRVRRNGETVPVTEPSDFAQIIRRRLFKTSDVREVGVETSRALVEAAKLGPWPEQVFNKLGTGRTLTTLNERVVETYPFHPDLFSLVSKEWTVVQAFQRVRSTVAIFARTALYWRNEHLAERWAPTLIGPGDLPLHTDVLEAVLSSGVLANNQRASQGFRAVASTDIINSEGSGGTARNIDRRFECDRIEVNQPNPATRMATACFAYSLVSRPRGARGATKAELLASISGPGVAYSGAEEVFNALVAPPVDGGLSALERTGTFGRGSERFYLSIKQTLNMYHSTAMNMISGEESLDLVWSRAQVLTKKGPFSAVHFVGSIGGRSSLESFEGLDSQETRLVVLDPRGWTLLNGKDSGTRSDLDKAFGVLPGLPSTFSASMVVSVSATQKRDRAKAFARQALAWRHVVSQLSEEDEEFGEACNRRDAARLRLDEEVKLAYRHYAYLLRTGDGPEVQYKSLTELCSSLIGSEVWAGLRADGRAVGVGELSAEYVSQLILTGKYGRDLTPKELFASPYSDPAWPMIQSDGDMRNALFVLATSVDWELVDSDGAEVRPASPSQIQPATLQQTLRRRKVNNVPPGQTGDDEGGGSTGGDESGGSTDGEEGTNDHGGSSSPHDQPTYETTYLMLPFASLNDSDSTEKYWHAVRSLASLLDPAQAEDRDIQMVGLTIKISSRTGDTADVVAKVRKISGSSVKVEEDDF